MSHVIAALPDITLIYLTVSFIATLTYTGVLYLRGLTASLLHVLTWGATYALVWPGTTTILSVLGIYSLPNKKYRRKCCRRALFLFRFVVGR